MISRCGLIRRSESRGDEVKSGESVTKRAAEGGGGRDLTDKI